MLNIGTVAVIIIIGLVVMTAGLMRREDVAQPEHCSILGTPLPADDRLKALLEVVDYDIDDRRTPYR